MIQIGQKVTFNPLAWMLWYGQQVYTEKVVGTVVFVHEEHRWFLVEYGEGKDKIKVAFSFNNIGKSVKFV